MQLYIRRRRVDNACKEKCAGAKDGTIGSVCIITSRETNNALVLRLHGRKIGAAIGRLEGQCTVGTIQQIVIVYSNSGKNQKGGKEEYR